MTETEILQPDDAGIARAAKLLREGALVAFATETVYGLGADAGDDRAVARVYEAKGRPSFNPLIVHLADVGAVARIARLNDNARRLAEAFWPGPLTLVLPLKQDAPISRLVTAGLGTVAVRVPAHAVARNLLTAAGRPIAAPSANPSGRISPTTAAHVLQGLDGRIAAVLDAGACGVGVESTIVDATGDLRLLRPGGVVLEDIEAVAGPIKTDMPVSPSAPNSPGQLASHYAPKAPLRLNADKADPGEVFLGFGGTPEADLDLSASGDLLEAAANLFGMLHELDEKGLPIAVAAIPDTGLGRAINDRLRRAAAPRD